MTDYRIYLLGDDGLIVTSSEADCANDQDAYALANGMLKAGARAEVWNLARLVGQTTGTSPSETTPPVVAVQG